MKTPLPGDLRVGMAICGRSWGAVGELLSREVYSEKIRAHVYLAHVRMSNIYTDSRGSCCYTNCTDLTTICTSNKVRIFLLEYYFKKNTFLNFFSLTTDIFCFFFIFFSSSFFLHLFFFHLSSFFF